MPVQFKIHKLGALRNTSFEFKPFMLFSGDSGLGKSYAAFLSYYLINAFADVQFLVPFIEEVFQKKASEINQLTEASVTISSSQFKNWLNRNASRYIGYLIGNEALDADIEIDFEVPDCTISYSTTEDNGKKIITKTYDNTNFDPSPLTTSYINHLTISCQCYFASCLVTKVVQEAILLPPARAALMGANINSTNAIMSTGMYKEFVDALDWILSASYEDKEVPAYLTGSLEDILRGKLIKQEGRLYYTVNDTKLPISAAASSVKELSPLFLTLQKYEAKDISILIEEPEAHLHPRMQMKVADLIVHAVNDGASFQVTTHSDYFMGRINDLLKLHYIKSNVSVEAYTTLCNQTELDPKLTLDPEKIGAYYLRRREDGSVEIITQETNKGIPFDTFSDVVEQTTSVSFALDNFMEEHNIE